MLKIGKLKVSSPLILAPMAGISDLPFRMLNRSFGCVLAFVEMINARSLSYKNKRTNIMLSSNAKDKPLGVQLLGCEPEYIKKAQEILLSHKPDLLDFNAACPAKKVVRRGEGASLLKDPKKLHKLLKLLVKNSNVPLTVKIRSGWDKNTINAREVGLLAEDAGVDAIFIHGRSRAQGYSGKVDYEAIQSVKKAAKIPVIASGDIWSAQFAKKMFDETGCDGIIIARGSLGNPWLFKEIEHFLKTGKILPKPEISEILDIIYKHLDLCIDFYGERVAVVLFRKFIGWYLKGYRHIRVIREEITHIKTKAELEKILGKYI